jgi:hypothetical protein
LPTGLLFTLLLLLRTFAQPAPGPAVRSRAAAAPAPEKADLVLTGGAVYTVNARQPWATAVAVRDGRIVYVGSDQGARPFTGPGTRVIPLKGRMVLPGFIDSHLHPSGGLSLSQVKLEQVFNRQEVARRIGAYAGAHPQAPWVLGRGWEAGAFKPSGIPDRHLLDSLVPDRPAFLSASDGHTGWANTKALALAGITRTTPDPANGIIGKDAAGEPNGVLYESAIDLLARHIPRPTARRPAARQPALSASPARSGHYGHHGRRRRRGYGFGLCRPGPRRRTHGPDGDLPAVRPRRERQPPGGPLRRTPRAGGPGQPAAHGGEDHARRHH